MKPFVGATAAERSRVPGLATVGHHVRAATQIAAGRPAAWLGLRAAAATALPLALAPWLGPVAATWAPLAGFVVALVDKGGAYRTRAVTMASVAVGALLGMIVGSLVAHTGVLAIVVVTIAIAGCALAQAWGATGTSVGNATAVQLIVASSLPIGPGDLGRRVAAFAAGAAWAMFLGLVVWPVRVYKPGRRSVAGVLAALADHAESIARFERHDAGWRDDLARRHRELRDQLEVARRTLAATRRGRRGETGRGERLLAIVEACDRMFGTLVGLEEVLDAGCPPGTVRVLGRGLGQHAAALVELGARVMIETRQAPPRAPGWDAGAARAELAAQDEGSPATEQALMILVRADEHRRVVAELIDTLVDDTEPLRARVAIVDQEPAFLERLRATLVLDSAVLRHALRVALGVLAATSLASMLHLKYGYWVTMTMFLLLQPHRAATTTRALQRIAGTVAGAVLAAAIAWAVRDQTLMMAIIVVLAGVSASVLQLNYGLYALFLTPTFVLLAEVHTHDFTLVGTRVANTMIGGALAFVAGALLWPGREHVRFGEQMARALEAAADYLGAVIDAVAEDTPPPAQAIGVTRRALGLALNNAEVALERVVAERAKTELLEPRMTLMTFTRRLAAAISAFGSARAVVAYGPHTAELSAFASSVRERLNELAGAVRAGAVPRSRQRVDPRVDDALIAARLERIELQLSVLADAASRAAGS